MVNSNDVVKKVNEELNELKNKQLDYFLLFSTIIFGFLVALTFLRVLRTNYYNIISVHIVNYAVLCISILPFVKKNYFFKKYLPLPIFVISAELVLIEAGNVGIGYMLLLVGVLYVLYFFKKRFFFIYVSIITLSILGIVVTRMSGNTYLQNIDANNIDSVAYVAKLIFFIVIIIQLYYLFNDYTIKLKSSFIQSHEALEALSEEKNLNDVFTNSAPGMFYLYDENWQLVRWNKRLVEMSGYDESELYGRKAIDWFGGEDQDAVRQAISKILVQGEVAVEVNFKSKDNRIIPMLLTGRRVEIDNKYYFCGMGIDISEKRNLENEVRQAQKMEALGTIAGGIAHDLNNVIGAIIGFSEFIQEDVQEGNVPKLNYVTNVINASERAAGIVKQILMFSRKTETKKLPIQVRSVTRDALKLIKRTIPKSITVNEDLEDSDLTVLADVNQIHQVIMNICTNGWHAMRDAGGVLSVKLYSREVDRDELVADTKAIPGIYNIIEIADTGTGIEKEVLKKMFSPFFTTKKEGEGTGLGLSVVNKIVDNHGGFITVDSVVGKGTTFKIFLPVTEQQQVYYNIDAADIVQGGSEMILVVDDEPQLREATVVSLDKLGYNVIAAEDGHEGLTRFKDNQDKISLVITDLAMPRMTGFQMSKKIRELKPDMPLILCTGYSESFDEKQVPTDFFNAFLHKPIRKKKIANAIRRVFNGEIVTDDDLH